MTQSDTEPTTSPSTTELSLRPYQVAGVDFLCRRNPMRGMIADVMGTGKTAQALAAVDLNGCYPALVVCPKIAEPVWAREIKRWLPTCECRIHTGNYARREDVRKSFRLIKGQKILVTHYEVFDELYPDFNTIIFDEAHRLRNYNKTLTYKRAKKFRNVPHMIMLTGTPIVKHPVELLSYLMLLDPQRFTGYWKEVERHFHLVKGEWGGIEISPPKSPATYRALIDEYIIRRDKRQALPGLPEKVRTRLDIEMLPEQAELYRQVTEELMAELPDGKLLLVPTVVAQITRLRQILVDPRLIGDNKPGAALTALHELLKDAREIKQPMVIFTPFRKVVPLIEEMLDGLKMRHVAITGGMTYQGLAQAVEDFQESRADVAICTIKVAESFDLARASRVVFLGAEWNATENEQAEDRVHRFGQTKVVSVQYIVHTGTVDEYVLGLVERKYNAAKQVLDAREVLYGTEGER